MRLSKAVAVPRKASMLRAPAISATLQRFSASRITSEPIAVMIWVPLMSDKPSLGSKMCGLILARRKKKPSCR